MKSSAKNVKLTSVDDLFSTEESRQEDALEKVRSIALSELFPFPDHPFAVRDDDSMKETVESVKEYGVLVPAIARPREGGGYELVSGHRRKRACELAGLETMPVIIRDMDRDTAIATLLAIIDYALYGVEPKLTGKMPASIFTVVRPNIDANAARRRPGKKGGRPKKTTGFQNVKSNEGLRMKYIGMKYPPYPPRGET